MERKTIARIERANNSVNGNPNYWITFTDYERYRTSSDAGFSYGIGNPDMREGSEVLVKFTKSGRIADMRPVEHPHNGAHT